MTTARPSAAALKADVLSALAHPNRIRILEFLGTNVRCNCEIAPALRIEQSNLSRHLRILTQAGVLVSWKEGPRVNFKVADESIFRILETATTLARRQASRTADAIREPHQGDHLP
jgi:ArsR family transcriptional regulator